MMAEHKEHSSKASEEAMRENDAHSQKQNSHDAVPGDDTAHAHSQAAHLKEEHGKTKHEGNQPGGSKDGELREPAHEVGRFGRENQRKE